MVFSNEKTLPFVPTGSPFCILSFCYLHQLLPKCGGHWPDPALEPSLLIQNRLWVTYCLLVSPIILQPNSGCLGFFFFKFPHVSVFPYCCFSTNSVAAPSTTVVLISYCSSAATSSSPVIRATACGNSVPSHTTKGNLIKISTHL